MANVEAFVRDLVNRDRDCTEQAQAQMDLRRKINLLIGEWKAAGGGKVLPAEERDPARAPLRHATQVVDGGRRWRETRTPIGF